MTQTSITFHEIQTSELLYYDADIRAQCLRFCQDRDIDCLPSLNNPMKLFRRIETGFIEEDITPEKTVGGNEFIFDPSLMERFRSNYLLFVLEDNALGGVVHFSDYNRPAVNTFLFGLLSNYERSLRKLLMLSHLSNQDMLDYFKRNAENIKKSGTTRAIFQKKFDDYQEDRVKNNKLPPFEQFYLKDLESLAGHHKIIKVTEEKVNDLRNTVMHAHEFVNVQDVGRDDYIYDFKSFEIFFDRVTALIQDYRRVNNRVAFLTLMEA
jgi:hypothetical protein